MFASVTHYLASTTLLWFRENIVLLTWLNQLHLSLYEHNRVGLEVSTILRGVMGSQNSKSIEQRCSASGYSLGWRSRVLHQPVIFNQSKWTNSIWPWRTRLIAPHNRNLNEVVLQLFTKFGGSSWNSWWLIMWKTSWLTDTHTDRHTHVGNDNTQRSKLASGKKKKYLIASDRTLTMMGKCITWIC